MPLHLFLRRLSILLPLGDDLEGDATGVDDKIEDVGKEDTGGKHRETRVAYTKKAPTNFREKRIFIEVEVVVLEKQCSFYRRSLIAA